MKNWFKTGIYSKQMTVIMVFVGILCLSHLSSCVNNIFDSAFAAKPDTEVLVKGEQFNNPIQMEDIEENGVKFTAPDGRIIMMPKEMRADEKLEGFYEDGIVRIYVDDKEGNNPKIREDYRIQLQDDFIEIWDVHHNRLLGTLTYKTSLGRMIDDDNFKYRRK